MNEMNEWVMVNGMTWQMYNKEHSHDKCQSRKTCVLGQEHRVYSYQMSYSCQLYNI